MKEENQVITETQQPNVDIKPTTVVVLNPKPCFEDWDAEPTEEQLARTRVCEGSADSD